MNVRNDAKVVLCYGDSNTYGQRSDDVFKGRWPTSIRWTGRLQAFLGDGYYIIEEGLSSRTTDLEYLKPGYNGKTYLIPCLKSHNPIDVVVLMLGTNDYRTMYGRSEAEIASAIEGLLDDVETHAPTATVIVVSPIYINDKAPQFDALYSKNYDHESVRKSVALGGLLHGIAVSRGMVFVNAAEVARAGDDGVHFDKASHTSFAEHLAPIIMSDR
jgi:lysophospholipase L1-like esterase